MDHESSELGSADNDMDSSRAVTVTKLPRFMRRRLNLKSLTGTERESASMYRAWKAGHISRETYMTAVRGLSAHKDILQLVKDEKMQAAMLENGRKLEQLLSAGSLPPVAQTAECS